MRREAENRAEKFIKKRLLKKRLAGMLLVMSLIVGSVTMYMLKHSAVAVSDEAAEEVGMVMEGENDSDGGEEIVVEEMENDQAEENSAEETDGSESHGSEPEQNEAEESDENSVAEESSNEENKENSDETSGEEVTEGSNEESSEESVPTEEAQESSEVSLEAGAEKQLESSSGSNDTDENSVSNNTSEESEEKESTEDNEKQVVSDNEASGEGSSQEEDVEKTVSDNTASDEAASNDSDEKNAVSDNNTEKESASDNSVSNNDAAEDSASDNSVSDNSVSDNSVSNNSVSGNSVSDDSVSKNAVKTEYVYEDSKVKVIATLERADAIPDDAEFKVTEVTKTTKDYNYDAYMDALNEGVSGNKVSENSVQYDESNTLLYDIAFISDGKEVEPKEGSVSISAEFKKNQLTEDLSVEDKEDIAVIHLPIKEEVKESTDIVNTQTATQISSNDIEVKTLTETTVDVSDGEKIEFSEDSFSIYAITVYQSYEAGTDNYKTVLGDAINYGITADTFSLGGDSQTNFAARYVSNAVHQTGNNLTNEAEQTFMIGSIASGYTLNYRGGSYPAYFLIPSKYSNQLNNSGNSNTYFKVDTSYSYEDIKKDVSDMLSYAKAASKELASRSQTAWLSDSNSKWVLDIRNKPDGTYYVTMNASDMEKIAEADKLQIYKNDGQTVVFNVTSSKTLYMFKYSVNGVGSDSMLNKNSYSKVSESIIWNFTKATTIYAYGSVVGTFIAPTSVWYNHATSAGWLVAKTAYIYSGEWHNIYNGVKQISGTAVFEAYKNIDGSVAKASGFEFTLYQKESGSWKKVETVKNDNHNITFSPVTYSEKNTNLWNVGATQDFVYKIKETAGTKDSHGNAYIADSTEYFAKVTVTLKNNGKNYYTVSEPVYYTDESCKNKYTAEDRPVFNNVIGGNLRIHKMVVNDFGEGFVRNNTGTALLSNVRFRITNNDSGNYIVFTGFTGKSGEAIADRAVEYDKDTHAKTGRTFTVVYNNSAQWTVLAIPAGTYTVDEVADGLTLEYHEDSNTVSPLEGSGLSRVTKYDLTVDDESTYTNNGTGGENKRRIFSRDINISPRVFGIIAEPYDHHNDKGPNNVKVGDSSVSNTSHTQTVQVCNYYSTPLAPISVNKCFSGGEWGENDVFEFKVEAVEANAVLSDGVTKISFSKEKIPMPEKKTVTLSKKDAVKAADGNYYAGVNFGNIYYTYEGTYKYKVTEIEGNNTNITYDSNAYYVIVNVKKAYTTFKKEYKAKNIPHFSDYKSYYDSVDWAKGAYTYTDSDEGLHIHTVEDFYYLAAEEEYTDASGKSLAKAKLWLGKNPITSNIKDAKYFFEFQYGDFITFNNKMLSSIVIKKIWQNSDGKEIKETGQFSPVFIRLSRYASTINKSEVIGTYILSSENGWQVTESGLDRYYNDGNKSISYVYSIEEIYEKSSGVWVPVENNVEYEYVGGNERDISLTGNDTEFTVICKNTRSDYVLPATGGIGTTPIRSLGMGIMIVAIMGIAGLFFRNKKYLG